MDRRAFLTTVAAGWMVDTILPGKAPIAGRIIGASHGVGHLVRDGGAPTPSGPPDRADVVIVGAGIAGLSAAWRLAPAGLDVRVLELEQFLGGTSTWGDDGAAPHPWGAHYLAAPNPEARAALRLLEQMGVVKGWDAAGRPRFDPRVLCHAPQERIFYRGAWHPGLVPQDELDAHDRAEMERFSRFEDELTERVGADGKPVFQIPLAFSSRDPDTLALDRISMRAWLDREGYTSPFLRWYVRYACLDDFGAEPEEVSAWAALHYFAGRKLKTPELDGSHFLVWPEGNGKLVQALSERARATVTHGALVTGLVAIEGGRVEVRWLDVRDRAPRRTHARAVVVAAPAFVTRRLFPSAAARLPTRTSSPWIVANMHVERPIDPDMAWDSVLYDAAGLGYVDARHQLTELSARTVLTYYRAYGGPDVVGARKGLVVAPWEQIANDVLRDLAPAHPELREQITRMDVCVWGHAMPRPRPGFLGEQPFEPLVLLDERVAWAHADQPGMALFEESQASGVRAAEALAPALGIALGSTWL
ncbi:FAD-dependent oxidoreductase [Polyangium fumosum]|uniref:FAD-dependent oxidoreductase n=2 Tax=Polyangium fumosum TaxID=889272 RepID=A0A4U1J8M4_9BACT|nr:FAD-dependent oxidoreductase [Polyangium fumosum]